MTRVVGGAEQPLRRSRGYAPRPVRLPLDCPRPILAVGGQLKATFALGRGRQAFLSHHLGDLDHYEAYRAFERTSPFTSNCSTSAPQLIAHDLHPDYASPATRGTSGAAGHPTSRACSITMPTWPVAWPTMGWTEPVIGVTFDGTGFGTDGAIWGGEFLVGDYREFRRAAHLRYVGLPGGDRAIREPWRMAVAHLRDAQAALPALEGTTFAS